MRKVTVLAFALSLVSSVSARADWFDDMHRDGDGFGGSFVIREADGISCPIPNLFATPQQVINKRVAALAAGDIDTVICTYAVGSTVVMPGSVISGRPAIKNAFLGMFALFGNAPPTITSLTFSGPIALLTYVVDTPQVTVPDGADTYVIRFGRIQYQTVTGSIQFH